MKTTSATAPAKAPRARSTSARATTEPSTKLAQDNDQLREKLEQVQRDHRWNYEDAMRAKNVQLNMVKMLRNMAQMIEGTIPRHFFEPDGHRHRLTDDDLPF